MKTIPVALQAHYDSGYTAMAGAIVFQRKDGEVFAFTSHDKPFSMDCTGLGVAGVQSFDATQGLKITSIVTTAGFNADNLNLETIDDGTLFKRQDVLAGRWSDAYFVVFRYRHDVAAPVVDTDVEVLKAGYVGDITSAANTLTVELRGLEERLQHGVGIVSAKRCRARLGSTTGASKCLKDLTTFTHNHTVTAVASKREFTASGAAQADDYFGEGYVVWTSGDNEGIECKVRSFSAGVFTFTLPVVYAIQVGDTFTAVAGCRGRLAEDCFAKFNNVLNFQGEPHRPLVDRLTRT